MILLAVNSFFFYSIYIYYNQPTKEHFNEQMKKHGGQDIYQLGDIANLKCDFSVTTNFMGSSAMGVNRIHEVIEQGYLGFYPPENQEPYLSSLLDFLYLKDIPAPSSPSSSTCGGYCYERNENVLLGNGASELIDLVIRTMALECQLKTYFVPGIQYKEYERSCKLNNLLYINKLENADMVCIVNPCNPTGEYLCIDDLFSKIVFQCKPGATLLIDESMQLWQSSEFRRDSLISKTRELRDLLAEKDVKVFIIHSWTKFFSCTGLRIGSVICPNEHYLNIVKQSQVSWSCNILALEYLNVAVKDTEYMNSTWNMAPRLRKMQATIIQSLFPSFKVKGCDFISWFWIDVGTEQIADRLYEISKRNNVPIRHGKMGYHQPTHIRIGVRDMDMFHVLIAAWKEEFSFFYFPEYRDHFFIQNVQVDDLKAHEMVNEDAAEELYQYLVSLGNNKFIPTVIVDSQTNTIIDGHHRIHALKKLGVHSVDVLYILDYIQQDFIFTNHYSTDDTHDDVTKEEVVSRASLQHLFTPKSTKHYVHYKNKDYPLICFSTLVHVE